MNPPDTQPDSEPRYIDPEEVDMSEQQFQASLEVVRPQFVVDEPLSACDPSLSIERTDGTCVASPTDTPSEMPQAEAGEPGSRSEASEDNEPDWRSLVSAKVNKYKSRRPQPQRYPSLSLQFEPTPIRAAPVLKQLENSRSAEGATVRQEGAFLEAEEPPMAPPVLAPLVERPTALEATARVLEFPRPATIRREELAEPVIDRPRIVEAPELLPPPPAMGGILIEPPADPEPGRRPGFDLPLQSASLSRKILAGILDGVVVATAITVFAYVFVRVSDAAVPARLAANWTAIFLALFWAAYQYAFLVFTKTTPGLFLTKLRVRQFDGSPVPRRLMRWRVLTSFLSCASLGLGYAWCFMDEDQLSWHDRITRTHLSA
jgi:uncharacterized RDD family membrane protein YckC